jgi:8-oxo-dGTP diphosphatase
MLIEVVAAVIELNGKLLAFKRGASKHAYVANKFEFPGGKVEEGENFEMALARELTEELGLRAKVSNHITTVTHTYPDFSIKMHCYLVRLQSYDGTLREHADYAHVSLVDALTLDWIEADKPVLDVLQRDYADIFK